MIQISYAKLVGLSEDDLVGSVEAVVARGSTPRETHRLQSVIGYPPAEGGEFEVGPEEVAYLLSELGFDSQNRRDLRRAKSSINAGATYRIKVQY